MNETRDILRYDASSVWLSDVHFEELLPYISEMEEEFLRVERIVGKELTPEAAYHYYDFYDLAQIIRNKLIAEVKDWPEKRVVPELNSIDTEAGWPMFRLCDILLQVVSVDRYNHGFLQKKIKDKTILKILKGLQRSFR
ncbi:hypothetical protein GCM10007049_25400 [Echinicola pacifica]|uniref:Uncharacterized protein n=1 Tax=Echinicola pacifica TaxID=346377 RepID=A0A918US51_9BACT|nr:DUF6508 domain-containing protein [Echinicola pacifica]GGZ31282.1 hypothetical protein GCM10007049_25400 [Echinicola pacifica]